MLLAAVLVASLHTPAALGHGDPVTEYLPTHQVFVPFDLKAPQPETEQLVALVDEANRAGFTIRVAIVWSHYDLGAVPELWHMPRRFARYVGADIRAAYKSRLLIVFSDGFGFSWAGHSPRSQRLPLQCWCDSRYGDDGASERSVRVTASARYGHRNTARW